jgi:prepilin-type N-terminal cleavage/methylation domain-containing protein
MNPQCDKISRARLSRDGFTLIELAIVLVIIGLIVGGMLVGQNLINAAGIRAQVTQIEKYNTAANTFQEKYGYLPGDITASAAAQFGFAPRGSCPGQGDGNGIIEGDTTCVAGSNDEAGGETLMFWVDLSAAHLIDGGFTTATSTSYFTESVTSTPSINAFFPAAKIGRGNYVYVYSSQNWNGSANLPTGINYFGLSALTAIVNSGIPPSTPALSVQEAYAIDTKVDDGMPETGRVTATYLGQGGSDGFVSGLPNSLGADYSLTSTAAMTGSATTCYDNGGVGGTWPRYSIEISNGSNITCALSFQFQAGD